MAELLGSLLVRLGLESGAFKSGLTAAEKQLKQAQKSFEKVGQSMSDFGRNMTLGVTLPLIAAAGAAVKGAQEQAAAMGQVEAALKSMGDVSGKTAAELAKNADALEMRSLFAADEILTKVTANLLTFGNVADEQFDRAQQAAVDMATRMGTDPQSAAIMLGKALNDPIKGITALTRVGVQFTDAQKKQIKAFQETGQTAKAQGVILAEVERQFKGAAQAAADTQPWRQAQVAIDQAMDKIGEAILPVIPVIANAVASLAASFASLSPEMQKVVLVAGALAAALGPVLFIVGNLVKLGAPLLAAMSAISAGTAAAGTAAGGASVGFGALAVAAAPWIAAAAAIAAVGYVIYQNWDKIAPVLSGLWDTISETLGPPLQEIIGTVSAMFGELWSGPFGEAIKEAGRRLAVFGAAVGKVLGPVILEVLRFLIQRLADVLKAFLDFGRMIGSLVNGDIVGAFKHLWSAINNFFGGLPAKVIGWMGQLVTGVKSWIVDKLSAVWNKVKADVKAVGDAFFWLYDAVVGHSYIPDMVDEIGQNMRRLDKELVEPTKKATTKAAEAFRALQEDVRGILDRLFPEVRDRLTFADEMAALSAWHKAGKSSADAHRVAMERLRLEYMKPLLNRGASAANDNFGQGADWMDARDNAVAAIRKGGADYGKVLDDVAKKSEALRVQVVESFSEMVDGALSQLDRFINGIKSGNWLDIVGGLLGALDKFGAIFTDGQGFNIGPATFGKIEGARAAGGPVSGGRTYLVGEQGPELFTPRMSGGIIPNHEMGGGVATIVPSPYFDVVVDGRIVRASPAIAQAGSLSAQSSMQRSGMRRVG